MSFFKKILASFENSFITANSIIQQAVLFPGKDINIKINIHGKHKKQIISNINLKLYCHYFEKKHTQKDNFFYKKHFIKISRSHTLSNWNLAFPFNIKSGEIRDFNISMNVPWNTPITINNTKVWLETKIHTSMSINSISNKELLTVRPDALMDQIFTVLEEQGLRIRHVKCETIEGFISPFIQKFEFVPTMGPYHGYWREIEIITHRSNNFLKLWFEINRNQTKNSKETLGKLLSIGKLKYQLEISTETCIQEVRNIVLNYINSTLWRKK
ncbi:sporulation protein [Candidatus Photodesmus anomalopis]|nr:sporulation protein [Candidatus Photodesmus katoptron]